MRLVKRRNALVRAFVSYGVPVRVEVNDVKLWAEVDPILPPELIPCDQKHATHCFSLARQDAESFTFAMDGISWVRHAALAVAVGALDQQLRLYIAGRAPDLVFVHAGVAALGEAAIIIPGRSFSGKTTLVRALVEAGAAYMSDEYAVLDAEGSVHPYARRLSIRAGYGTPHGEWDVAELGGVAAHRTARAALVVLTCYRTDGHWQPKRRTTADGVVAVLANTVKAQAHPRECLTAVSRSLTGARVLESDRGDAAVCASHLLGEL